MATKKKLLEAAAGTGGGDPLSLDNLSWQGTGDIPYCWLGANLSGTEAFAMSTDGTKIYLGGYKYTDPDPDGFTGVIRQWTLSSAYDFNTLDVFDYVDLDVSANVTSNNIKSMYFKPDGTRLYILDGNVKDVTEYHLSTAWDISTATYDSEVSVSEGTTLHGLTFNDVTTTGAGAAGRYMYVLDISGTDQVRMYELSTPWDVSTASYYTTGTLANTSSGRGLAWGNDGQILYVTDNSGDKISSYIPSSSPYFTSSLTGSDQLAVDFETNTPNGIHVRNSNNIYFYDSAFERIVHITASNWSLASSDIKYPTSDYLDIEGTSPIRAARASDMHFKPDGTKLYVTGNTLDSVLEYNLSTAWDIDTATYSTIFYVNSYETSPLGIAMSADGTKLFIVGSATDTVYEFTLSTGWDLSTAASAPTDQLSIIDVTGIPTSLNFSSDGTELFTKSYYGATFKISLASAYELTGATLPAIPKVYVGASEAAPQGVFLNSTGTKMWIIGPGSGEMQEWNLSTAWDITTASNTGVYVNLSGTETNLTDVYWKPDGTRFFYIGTGSDTLRQRDAATAGTLSGGTYGGLPNLDLQVMVDSNITAPEGLFFKPDGTKFYILNDSTTSVFEASLGTAWDLNSTITKLNEFDLSDRVVNAMAISFKSDGTEMYVCCKYTDRIVQYSLSTAWDTSTATFTAFGDVPSDMVNPEGMYFKGDGTMVYLTDVTMDSVYECELTTAWDITTITYNAPTDSYLELRNLEEQEPFHTIVTYGGAFSSDGKNYYVNSEGELHRFTLPTAYSFTGAELAESKPFPYSLTFGLSIAGDDSRLYISTDGEADLWAFNF